MRINWPLVCGSWLLMAAMMVAVLVNTGPPSLAGDDAMRMVQAMDLLSGQSWTDTTNYRDNTPYGAPMHWSRLIDAPLALMIWVFGPFMGAGAPEAAALVWPPLLLLGLFALVMALSDRLGGSAARIPAMAFTLLALPIYTEFTPGRIDHHNVQMMLTLGVMLTTIAGRVSATAAAGAGLLAATGLAIGTESLPTMVVALAAFPLFWLFDPVRYRGVATVFALSFGLSTASHWLVAAPWPALLQPGCDALSFTYVTIAGLYAIGILAAMQGTALPLPWRLAALAAAGAVTLGLAAALFPACLGGPYGDLDPSVAATLLTDIAEALPIWQIWVTRPPATGALFVLPLTGLLAIIAGCIVMRGDKRADWLVLLGFSVALVLVMILQVRGARLAILPALPAGAMVVAMAWQRFRRGQTLRSAGLVLVTCMAFSGAAHFALAKALLPAGRGQSPQSEDCFESASYEALAKLSAGRIVSFLIMGPQILYNTHHSIVSAGFHRNEAGLRDAVRFFSGDEAEALSVVKARGLDYYVFCRGIPPETGLHGLAPFHPVDSAGRLWWWLTPLTTPEEPIQIYAIAPSTR